MCRGGGTPAARARTYGYGGVLFRPRLGVDTQPTLVGVRAEIEAMGYDTS